MSRTLTYKWLNLIILNLVADSVDYSSAFTLGPWTQKQHIHSNKDIQIAEEDDSSAEKMRRPVFNHSFDTKGSVDNRTETNFFQVP